MSYETKIYKKLYFIELLERRKETQHSRLKNDFIIISSPSFPGGARNVLQRWLPVFLWYARDNKFYIWKLFNLNQFPFGSSMHESPNLSFNSLVQTAHIKAPIWVTILFRKLHAWKPECHLQLHLANFIYESTNVILNASLRPTNCTHESPRVNFNSSFQIVHMRAPISVLNLKCHFNIKYQVAQV